VAVVGLAANPINQGMSEACPLLRELDAWFAVALDLLSGDPDVRRDVLLLVGGAGTPATVSRVTRGDCHEQHDLLFVYPPNAPGRALPLTPAFAEVAGLSPESFPFFRNDPAGDEEAVVAAVDAVDAALARLSGVERDGGPDRLRSLRMHAWKHELGAHVGVLARCYGSELPELLSEAGTCPETPAAQAIPSQRTARVVMPVG
jgi:hypothetical protein